MGIVRRSTMGDYYTIDTQRNWVVEKHVDPEDIGRELKVLHEWECLEEDEG